MNQIELLNQLGKQLLEAKSLEEYKRIQSELLALSPETRREIDKVAMRAIASKGVTVKSFLAFYELLYGFRLPVHMDKAVRKAFVAHEQGLPFVLLGSRGFWKTVTFITLDAFLIGHHPEQTGLITGANDGNCNIIAKQIAAIIEFNPEWKSVFPHVTPKEKAWGADGYWVMDNRVPREQWEAQQAGRIDPTFIGGGYASSSINGKHPSLFLHVDDLHDIDSWKSETERTKIKDVFLSQIIKTVIRKNDKLETWVNLLGVPFSKDDTLNSMIATGQCVAMILPCMVRAKDGEGVYIDGKNTATGAIYDDIVGWWHLTWEEHFGVKSVISERANGKFAFWQMYMMDVETAGKMGLRYYSMEEGKIPEDIPMVGGADPTTFQKSQGQHSSFALCHLGKLPNHTAVVVDGYLKACELTEARDAILAAQSLYPNWRITGVENVGVGKVFFQYLKTDPRIKAVDSNLSQKGTVRSKEERIKHEVSPWMESATVLISNKDSDYLRALRKLFDNFYDLPPHDEAWDAGDALYHAMKLIPEILRIPYSGAELNTPEKQKKQNPYHLESVWSSL
ncbi:MAG: hypothetical protein E6R03_15685 [Hyphomicrobiaceae bacterium]|nr:MAG: hypothetical protein E6R03_15685 [Hyphomicrobiaceae bacterium]